MHEQSCFSNKQILKTHLIKSCLWKLSFAAQIEGVSLNYKMKWKKKKVETGTIDELFTPKLLNFWLIDPK